MKLLYITNGITGVGGLERVLSIKASYLAEQMGYQVCIVSLDEEGIAPFYHFSPQIIFRSVDTRKSRLAYFSGIRHTVKTFQPDIICVCDDGLKGLFVPLWVGGKAKIVYERHTSKEMVTQGEEPNFKQRIVFALMEVGSRLYDRFVVLTNYNKQQWGGKNVRVIPNPLSFYPQTVSDLENKRIISVGKVSMMKGNDRLVEAWQLIRDKHPGWSVHIYGNVYDNGYLEKMIGEDTTIQIHPPVQNIEQEYLSSSIYALPSRFEGFGMVLTEAMACGVPCLAFDCPCGPSDIITDGEDGFLVKNGDIEEFSRKLSLLIENDDLRNTMGKNARQNVTRYDVKTIALQWDTLFREL